MLCRVKIYNLFGVKMGRGKEHFQHLVVKMPIFTTNVL
jgi:hypothetical protein